MKTDFHNLMAPIPLAIEHSETILRLDDDATMRQGHLPFRGWLGYIAVYITYKLLIN